MDGEIIEGDREFEGRVGGLRVFGRGLPGEKNWREYQEYQTYTFHGRRDHKPRERLIEGWATRGIGNSALARVSSASSKTSEKRGGIYRRGAGPAPALQVHFRRNSFLGLGFILLA